MNHFWLSSETGIIAMDYEYDNPFEISLNWFPLEMKFMCVAAEQAMNKWSRE